jgi:hypothetical protein
VKWWIKTTDDPEDRTYEEWQPMPEDIEVYGIETANGGAYFLINSTELRHVGFQMDAITPLGAGVPVVQRARRARGQAEHPSTAGRRFQVPADVENQILALCWA